jgi:iron complex outermembrane receptor protein
MKSYYSSALAGAGLVVFAALMPARAQQTNGGPSAAATGGEALEEIVVTAQRREQDLQDVPLTVNVVSAESIQNLDLRNFTDISAVVPGLFFNGIAVTLRGISTDPNSVVAQNNVEFYFNDAPVGTNVLFNSLFDVGQIEVLRGPQGTLRGTSAPSGSVTLTSQLPSLSKVEGYADVTGNSLDTINVQAAVNLPIIQDKLAVRLAAVVEDGQGNQVRSINNPENPYERTYGLRATVRFEPTDSVSTLLTYQYLENQVLSYQQVESFSLVSPGTAAVAPLIQTNDWSSIAGKPDFRETIQNIVNAHIDWSFAGQKLSYVGAYWLQYTNSLLDIDYANLFPATPDLEPEFSKQSQVSNELRLASEERIFGFLDYVVGTFYDKQPTVTKVAQPTLISAPAILNIPPLYYSNIFTTTAPKETSFYGNLTAHLGDRVEVSGGARHIISEDVSYLGVTPTPGVLQNNIHQDGRPTIYNGSLTYHFNSDMMVYAQTGSSWRKGPNVIGIFRPLTPLLNDFTNLQDETSKSYEVGFKSDFFDRRLRFDATAYLQNFDNYIYRGPDVYYVNEVAGTELPGQFNFNASVPVRVTGVELEAAAQVTRSFTLDTNISYAHSMIRDGLIACNKVNAATAPTVAEILASAGGEAVAACNVNYPASTAPELVGSLQGDYHVPLNDRLEGDARGLVTYNSHSPEDPGNPYDSVKAYALVNLYLGIRAPQSGWQAEVYAKNLFGTERVLQIGNGPLTTSYTAIPQGGISGIAPYISTTLNPRREFGFHVRYSFGSH